MDHSETTTALMAAMVKAQAEMQGATKGSENPFFKSKYADLGAVMAATKDALHAHGLAIIQFPIDRDNKCGVETVVCHESGEWMSQECLLATSKQDPQAYGSAITYARRYGWQAVCGIPSEDDDGNHATHGRSKPKKDPKKDPLYEQASKLLVDKQGILKPDQVDWCTAQISAGNHKAVIDQLKGL